LDELSRTIGANVRRLRRARGLTQEQLAERTEVGRHFLSDIETGRRRASVDTLVRLIRALETSADLVLGLRSATKQAIAAPVDYLLLKPLWDELREVPPEYGRIVVRTARQIARDFKRVAVRKRSP
jgi:transcriptional regulator with XRE-family HTH domain